ncbi:hypothetical protein ES703_79014 [subsurface metagenome]
MICKSINYLKNCDWDSLIILKHLRNDTHFYNKRLVLDYPFLRGPKMGSLCLRVLKDNVGVTQLKNLDKVSIPVDIHVARATLMTGVIRGTARIRLDKFFENVRKAWFESVKDLKIKDRSMIALDVDKPLWVLSKYGCTNRDKIIGYCHVYSECVVKDFCIKGKVKIENNFVELET